MKKATELRNLIKNERLLIVPGASTALLGKVVELMGFKAVYASGAGIANMQFGVPDIGLVTMSEILETTKRINDATTLPVIADIDNGYGNSLNVYRTVKEFSAIGIAALQLEDQQLPKRCGHFNGKLIISTEEMVSKIKAAKDALRDTDVMLIARTDAIAINGLEDALERGALYAEAGADILFVEAPIDIEQMRRIAGTLKTYTIANIVEGGKTPILHNSELEKMGFKIALYANAPLKAAIKGTKNLLNYLATKGTTADCEDFMITMQERNEITGLSIMTELERKYKS